MKTTIFLLLFCLNIAFVTGQNLNPQYVKFDDATRPEVRTTIRIPDILGFKTLKCDFHLHTYFSDGEVTPTMRADEAWCEGLDAIAITDHNKYKKSFLSTDYNMSYNIAKKRGDEIGLIVIKGVEYTDKKPVGHLNFLFIDDANQYDANIIQPDAAVELAASKGAFIIYNHPGWPDRNSDLFDFQKKFISQKKIGAIEVFNHAEFYPNVINYCLDNNIAPVGCSDSHSPVNYDYDLSVNKRTMTLVLSKESTEAGIKEALFAGRTVAFSNNTLAGKEEYIKAIFSNSFDVVRLKEEKEQVLFNLTNKSDITYYLEFEGRTASLPANKTIQMKIKKADFERVFILKNGFCGSLKNVQVSLPLK